MVSVNIRMGMVQAATPEQLRGRVAAVNMLFIQTSNEGGDFRGGALAGLVGPVYTVLVGGVLGLGFLVEQEAVSGTLQPRQDLRPLTTGIGRWYMISVCLAYYGSGNHRRHCRR